MNPRHEKESNVRLPEEKKGPDCAHAPADWAECVKCVEDYYLARLIAEQAARIELERPLAMLGWLLREASARLFGQPCAPPVSPRFSRLADLVDVWADAGAPGRWRGQGKVFSVLKDALPFSGASPDEVLERALIAVLGELEAQKAALEIRAELAEAKQAQAEKALQVEAARAEELRALAEELASQKDGAYAERNELAVLVATAARALGLRAGWRQDPGAEDGWQTLVMAQLPSGQVSWHLPDSERDLAKGLPPTSLPWDGHDKAEARRRVRQAIFSGDRERWP